MGAQELALGGFHAHHASGLDDNAPGLARGADLAAACLYDFRQGLGQPLRATNAELRFRRTGEKSRDVVAEAAQLQVHLAQAIEEKQPGAYHRVLELALYEL